MKKKKDFVLILVNCVLVLGIVLFTQLNARDQEQIHVAFGLESLVMPTEHTFSSAATSHLLRWINISIERLERSRKRPFSSRRKIDDALERLKKCNSKLTKENPSNNEIQNIGTNAPNADL